MGWGRMGKVADTGPGVEMVRGIMAVKAEADVVAMGMTESNRKERVKARNVLSG